MDKYIKLPVIDVPTAVGFVVAVAGAVLLLKMLPPTAKLLK